MFTTAVCLLLALVYTADAQVIPATLCQQFMEPHIRRQSLEVMDKLPQHCLENPAGSGFFYCEFKDLQQFPDDLPARTVCVSLYFNDFRTFNADSLLYLPNLRVLILDKNPLTDMKGDFSNLPLETLSLRQVYLNGIPSIHLPHLHTFIISNVYIRFLSKDSLSNISTELETVVLDTTYTYDSQPGTFAGLNYLRTLTMNNNNFTSVPSDLPQSLTKLDMSSNFNITTLKGFPSLPLLNELSISASSVEFDAFRNTPNIQTLNLQTCALRSNATQSLKVLKNFLLHLECLNQDSPLVLEPFALSGLQQVQSFTLSEIFPLPVVPVGLLYGALNLHTLNIEYVGVDKVEDGAFMGLPELTTLRLTDNYNFSNKTIDITSGTFSGANLKKLTQLDLSSFKVKSIDANAFDAMPSLRTLYIESDLIDTLSNKTILSLTNLTAVALDSNPWNCDCHLRWLKEMLDTKPDFFYHSAGMKCSKPQGLKGRAFIDLTPNDFICK